ncbi:SGNH/GDSL hydrolase family protein [Solirubrobacter soli]|uniref:SGNH/GDSL hydrolase family protein n=1 Tax=Solirubrobacter soli TaxID=363832 RepID=UPI00040CC5B0|nr:SGNH/GDSL hydrolase family protein [Solirubrobacter soli]
MSGLKPYNGQWPSPKWAVWHIAVFIAAVGGVIALWLDLSPVWRVVMAVVVIGVIAIRLIPLSHGNAGPLRTVENIGAFVSLIVVPVFALLGVDALLSVFFGPVDPVVGLVVGGLIIFGAGRVVLEPVWTANELDHRWLFAAMSALALTFGPGIVIAGLGQLNGDEGTLAARPMVTQLDVIVLRPGALPSGPETSPPQGDWRVKVWTGSVSGDEITWAGGQAPELNGQADADRVLLLLPPAGDNDAQARWLKLADQAEPRTTSTYALLTGATPDQLKRWRGPLTGMTGRVGDALPIGALGGPDATAAELGIRAATQSESATTDLALAIAHRPYLLFDSGERDARPLDVNELFKRGYMSMCEAGQKVRSRCVAIDGGNQLRTGFNHLAFDTKAVVADRTIPTRIYFNATRGPARGDEYPDGLILLDYWWYLPDNPADSGRGAFCGPGFSIGGVTCFNHQSDWEGVTVVLDAQHPDEAPVSVNYAEHDGSVRYSWAALQRLWAQTGVKPSDPVRAVVYPARGTHASYPSQCGDQSCPRGVLKNVGDASALTDRPHDGKVQWAGNTDDGCAAICVAALPTRTAGAEPASWNAWRGHWGTANCVMGVFCSSAQPPLSPGNQPRYQSPSCTGKAYDVAGAGYVAADRGCLIAPAPTRGRLLALGDSYSSGEGAGQYEPSSDTSGNSCHRSVNAWPRLVARERHITAMPSLACSGARLSDVLHGRPSGQSERRVSQLSRIGGAPDIITISIGGNDLGFAEVLKSCIATNCVRKYAQPSGDVLDRRIEQLALALPDAYRAIQAAAPGARIVVVDYPRLFPEGKPNCAAAKTITVAEGDYLNEKVERADVAILGAARQAGVSAVDVSRALAGGELSCSGRQFLNRVNPQLKVLSGSFHPNADGQEQIADAVLTGLAALDG